MITQTYWRILGFSYPVNFKTERVARALALPHQRVVPIEVPQEPNLEEPLVTHEDETVRTLIR